MLDNISIEMHLQIKHLKWQSYLSGINELKSYNT